MFINYNNAVGAFGTVPKGLKKDWRSNNNNNNKKKKKKKKKKKEEFIIKEANAVYWRKMIPRTGTVEWGWGDRLEIVQKTEVWP